MFRLLTSLPPGQVRFTIVDPIGIGRNFGAFMHLADFDAALVTNQVWTDPRQIEERLADLAAHMETVTQKYLRNEYATIEEYNAVAGEVAEPYRVLVVADFPAKFDEKSAAPAGRDRRRRRPLRRPDAGRRRPDRAAARRASGSTTSAPRCDRLTWDGGRLAWDDPDFGRLPAGARPAAAGRVRHPPDPEGRRRGPGRQARRGPLRVHRARRPTPGGPATAAPGSTSRWARPGATKRQHLTLGQGTSQHVLIAGRTGSGKSTLMHALITNLALNYSPDEIDLYLIDFKKGVEFKVYATHELPARQRRGDRERARVRHQRPPAARRRDAAAGRPVPRRRRAGPERLSQRARHAPPAADPADRRRVPGVLRRGGQARPGGRAPARPPGPPGPGLRRPRPPRLAEPRRRVHAWRGARSARWPCGSPCSAARPTRT